MPNYLTRRAGKEIKDTLPLQVDDVSQASNRTTISAEGVTFDCATAAGSRGIIALENAPILNLTGDKVGTFWNQEDNKVYEQVDTATFGALTETAGSAEIIITDKNQNLDEFYDTPSGSLRYMLKVTDNTGAVLYGFIGAIATSTDQYTIDIYSEAAMSNQDWVGTLASFDNSNIARVDIFRNPSSFVWGTGTVLLEEKFMDEEMTDEEIFANLDTNGDFSINYRTGTIYYRKATTGTSDTATYNTMTVSSTVSGAGTSMVDDSAFTAGTSRVTPMGAVFDDASPDSVDEGDIGAPRMSANRNLYTTIRDAAGNERGVNVTASNELNVTDAGIPSLGTAAMAGSMPVTLATDDTQYGAIGAAADVDGNIHGQLRYIGEGTDKLPALGSAAMAGAVPTTLATDDTQYGAVGAAADVDGNIHGQLRYIGEAVDSIPAVGSAAMAASLPFTLATDDTQFGAVGAAADVDGNIHGQLRYIGEAVDNIPAVGTAAMAASIPVTIATDDTVLLAVSKAIAGPAGPTIDSYTQVAINLTTGADQVLVSSAANKQVWVYGFGFTCGDADGQTVSLQDEDNLALTGIMEFSQYGGISVPPSGNFAMPVLKCATDKDLEVDITGGDVDGFLTYALVSV